MAVRCGNQRERPRSPLLGASYETVRKVPVDLGDKEGAMAIWDSALQSTPDDPRLLDVKKRFEQ